MDSVNGNALTRPITPQLVQHWKRHCPSFAALRNRDREIIYLQGEHGTQIHYVVAGYVKLTAVDYGGHGFIRSILHDGDFFGVMPGPSRQQTQDTAISKGPSLLYRCRTDEFSTLLDSQPEIARCLLDNLNRRLMFAQRQTEIILYRPAVARVALFLRELAGGYGGHCRHGHEIDIRLTQQELADMVGASRPVVSTILNDLRQRGIVDYTRTFICIENMALLERLLE